MSNAYSIPLAHINQYWRTLHIDFPATSSHLPPTIDSPPSSGPPSAPPSAPPSPSGPPSGPPSAPPSPSGPPSGPKRNLFGGIEITAPPIPSPPKKSKSKGSGRKSSAWEWVQKIVGFDPTPKKKGKGRVAGVCESQGSAMSMSHGRLSTSFLPDGPTNSASLGRSMSMSQGRGSPKALLGRSMSMSQGRGSPSSPSTPTSRPPKSPGTRFGGRKKVQDKDEPHIYYFAGSSIQHDFPPYLRKYIDYVIDVRSDGNCGFRAVAVVMYNDQDEWTRVRQELSADVRQRMYLYDDLMGGLTSMQGLIESLTHDRGRAPQTKWLTLPECGHVIATTYNVIVMSFSQNGGYTCLPAILDPAQPPPTRTIVLGNVQENSHWVLLGMNSANHPVPPVASYWESQHHHSADGIDVQFRDRITEFNKLHDKDAPRRARRFCRLQRKKNDV